MVFLLTLYQGTHKAMPISALLTDAELLELMAQDRREAFSEIYDRYWKKMLLVAWNHTKDKAQAEDIVHEVFIALWEKRESQNIVNVPAYLNTAVKFAVFKHYQRRRHREKLAEAHYAFVDLEDDEAKLDALFLKEYINGIVEQLPEKCRLTFYYSRTEGLNNAEIAARMGISEKGVEANLTRALKVIRGNLRNTGLIILLSPGIFKDLF
ncbi:RNA polymerase sigma-70 factor [Pedobacter deserti]|uniref:RNA polymerase sigma-70 factor n=1 Tax=Pedobacter deserti TaxID=2817382 RepID=UPI00210AE7B1|nr:RNA polymerase sigma-70 factor [Pedobacter sp. SYSU D00382]